MQIPIICFHFTPRSVVTFQESRRLRAQEKLAAAIRVCEQAEMALADAKARRDLLVDFAQSGRAFTLRAAQHMAFRCALSFAVEDESAAEHQVEQAHAIRDRWLSECFHAARSLKLLKNLKANTDFSRRIGKKMATSCAATKEAKIAGRLCSRIEDGPASGIQENYHS